MKLLSHPIHRTELQLIGFCGLFITASLTFAQTWTPTSAPTKNWMTVASSADGSKLVAASEFGGFYTSTNSGSTWATNSLFSPTHAASSADGINLAVAVGNSIDTSTNSGATWKTNRNLGSDISGIASSADGAKLVAVNPFGNGGHIYTSADAGVTWVTNTLSGKNWSAVASSADGSKLVAVANGGVSGGGIYTSTNSGITWASNNPGAPFPYWACVASSADGSKLAAGIGGNGDVIYTSTNSGSSWTSNNMPRQVWSSLASSADGSKLVAAAGNNGTIYTSIDSGTTWLSNSVPKIQWWAVASSADGNKLVAVVNGGGIYTLQTTPSPQLNLASSSGNLTFSWTVPSTNFILQQSSDLISWTDVTNTPTLDLTNLENQISLFPSNSIGFYRLATP